jgi:serine/threonine protein phosphatase 1
MKKYIKDNIFFNKPNLWGTAKSYGGYKTILSYKDDYNTLNKHLKFIKSINNYILINNYFLTHAYSLPYFKRRKNNEYNRALISNRNKEKQYKKDWEKHYLKYKFINIYGHCDFQDIKIKNNTLGIDTGCFYNNKLTAIKLDSIKVDNQNNIIKKNLIIFQEKTILKDIKD